MNEKIQQAFERGFIKRADEVIKKQMKQFESSRGASPVSITPRSVGESIYGTKTFPNVARAASSYIKKNPALGMDKQIDYNLLDKPVKLLNMSSPEGQSIKLNNDIPLSQVWKPIQRGFGGLFDANTRNVGVNFDSPLMDPESGMGLGKILNHEVLTHGTQNPNYLLNTQNLLNKHQSPLSMNAPMQLAAMPRKDLDQIYPPVLSDYIKNKIPDYNPPPPRKPQQLIESSVLPKALPAFPVSEMDARLAEIKREMVDGVRNKLRAQFSLPPILREQLHNFHKKQREEEANINYGDPKFDEKMVNLKKIERQFYKKLNEDSDSYWPTVEEKQWEDPEFYRPILYQEIMHPDYPYGHRIEDINDNSGATQLRAIMKLLEGDEQKQKEMFEYMLKRMPGLVNNRAATSDYPV